ncbi:MAG: hypothetical protein EHM87_25125, partial [Burkholderiales bacterium]
QTSTNGTTWATRHQLSGNSQLYGVGWLGGVWVAVGEPPGNDQGAGVYTSTNGIAWTATSAHRSGPLRAIGKTVHVGRQLATAEARIVGADGKLYAHGTTTCLVFEARSTLHATVAS